MGPLTLFVESAAPPLHELRRAFETAGGCAAVEACAPSTLRQRLESEPVPELVVVGWPEGGDGGTAELIRKIRARQDDLPVVAVAGRGDVHLAAAAVAAGATDFLVLGDRLEERAGTLLAKLAPMIALRRQNRALREQNVRLRQLERDRAGWWANRRRSATCWSGSRGWR